MMPSMTSGTLSVWPVIKGQRKQKTINFKSGMLLGIFSGIIWGWIAIAINLVSGVFPLESSLYYNIIVFSIGGAVFGLVVAGFLTISFDKLPFKKPIAKAILIAAALWLILRMFGSLLSTMEPARYHIITSQTIQGLILAVLFGCILGMLWQVQQRSSSPTR